MDTREKVGRAAAFFPTLKCTHSFTPRIVEEVRSIRFNQEQEEEMLHKQLSMSLSAESKSSLDLREMACQQDLITALVNMDKVQLPSLIQSMLTLRPPPPTQSSLCHIGQGFCLFQDLVCPLGSHTLQQLPPIQQSSYGPSMRGSAPSGPTH